MLPLLWPIAAALGAIVLISMLQRALGWGAAPASGAAPRRRPAFWRRSAAARPAAAAAAAAPARYLPWDGGSKDGPSFAADVLVVDCTHGAAQTITHHKGQRNPPAGLVASDCSTGLVLDALQAAASGGRAAKAIAPWLAKPYVSVNHFDADAVLSIWAYINRGAALQHSAVLRHAARIGDLREAGLGDSPQALEARQWDGVESEEQVHHALKLCCWINTIERRDFSPPYVDKDSSDKHEYFLARLADALTPAGIEALRPDWEEEYERVLAGWRAVQEGLPSSVERHEGLGLAVLRLQQPLHYYSAWSWAIGCDTVLTVLPWQRYELESRYTQFIDLHSRPVQARLELGPLARALNRIDSGRQAGMEWGASSLVDTGPILRLDRGGEKLSKAERYGHPTDRPHYASGLPPAAFEAVVCSYLQHGLAGAEL
ncbi:hypothetical protein C2E21_1135 [Chlorella sorokiniana]|uniref:Uncharacterized protein n=1 Tax=Chlorella sorokiniana TaxID=3076 RepID=A0A2P6U257_CHLSO|nr:hypothetical protein C2E21_1135 [Chlorella sorokiniana]|eukprot:PRW60398.1 hypothetical protein C2E21_1135 [Chlorella sorokiniana]